MKRKQPAAQPQDDENLDRVLGVAQLQSLSKSLINDQEKDLDSQQEMYDLVIHHTGSTKDFKKEKHNKKKKTIFHVSRPHEDLFTTQNELLLLLHQIKREYANDFEAIQ